VTAGDRYAALRAALECRLRVEQVVQETDEGTAYLARDLTLDRLVLVRALVPALAGPARTSEFARVVKALASLSDPHMPAVHFADLDGDFHFVVLEHPEGETLEQRLRHGPLSSNEIQRLGVQVLKTLEVAHAAGIVHAAITPGHVVVSEGRYLLDGFGCTPAAAEGAQADLDAAGRLLQEAAGGAPVRRVRKILSRRPRTATAFREALETASLRTVPLSRRRPRALLAILLVVGAIGVFALRSRPTLPLNPSPRELAILPLEVDGGQPLDPLGSNIAHLIQLDLEELPDLALTSRAQVHQWWSRLREGTPIDGASAARALQVHWVVHGLVERRPGDSLRVRLSLYDSSGTSSVVREVLGPSGHLAGIGDSISLRILRLVAPRSVNLYDPVGGFAGVPLPALKAFLQGEAAFARDSWALAQRYYERALDLDPAFALAEWRLANVKHWRRLSRGPDLADIYRRHASRFRQSDRRLIEALLEPDLERRFVRLENEIRRRPGDGYARLLQGEELFHRGPLAGRPMDEALAAMSTAVARDSSLALAYDHLVLGHTRFGRRAEARAALDLRRRAGRVGRAEDTDLVPFLELVYDERFARTRAWVRYQWLAWRKDPRTMEDIARLARIGVPWLDMPNTQLRYSDLLLMAEAPAAETHASAHEGKGLALFAMGRLAEAFGEIDSAASLFDTPEARLQQAEWRVVSRAVGLPVVDTMNWERRLADLARDSTIAGRATWVLALARLANGDTAGARHWAERLPASAPLRVLIDAGRAAAACDFSLALGRSDSVRVNFTATQPPDPFSSTVFHLLRGEWLVASGDPRRAEGEWMWHEASDIEGWPFGLSRAAEVSAAFGAFARLGRGCRHLERVKELWSEADSTVRSLLIKAARSEGCPE
jgi:tetratricopeptide (TPR) repeat protein